MLLLLGLLVVWVLLQLVQVFRCQWHHLGLCLLWWLGLLDGLAIRLLAINKRTHAFGHHAQVAAT